MIIPAFEAASVEEFDTVEELAARLSELDAGASQARVMCFLGTKLSTSRHPYRAVYGPGVPPVMFGRQAAVTEDDRVGADG